MVILTANKDEALDNDYVDIKYRVLTPRISQIIEICNQGTQVLWGKQDDKQFKINSHDILYIEWVDCQSCICTEKDVYTTKQSVTQLGKQLDVNRFIRISKSMLVNIHQIKWISSVWNMKVLVELKSGERVMVSRNYRHQLLDAIYKLGKEISK